MCYICDWPKRFLKIFLRQLSHYQVRDLINMSALHSMRTLFISPVAGGTSSSVRGLSCWDLWLRVISLLWRLFGVELLKGHFVLQVELLIDNEAEKDYLYDVLRMYHQWVHALIPCPSVWCVKGAIQSFLLVSDIFMQLFIFCLSYNKLIETPWRIESRYT